ncbi:alpha/beta fold hydrolase [Gaetbulibacter saemankumensis]|uniref:alpha/beta fold hydrolase n=1 Tax=Gaetbulibacter saemankumensis TaxID=311208 RepID=UPI0004104E08|nr:alpha/beta hydrolase [Gaetbulibacter saemankumensis]
MTITYKGAHVFFTDTGTGDTLVFLHGFLENHLMWQHVVPALSKKHRVICIDLPGHGQTECFGYIHSMELMAEVVEVVLLHLKIENATFFGHSMGGYVALAYAEKNTNKVKGLGLLNSTALPDTEEKRINRDRGIVAVKQNHKTFIRIAINNLFNPANSKKFEKDIKAITTRALQTPLQGIIAALEGMKIRSNREHIFQNGNFKKMMIASKNDPALDFNTLVNQTKYSDVYFVEFPDGHMSYIENERLFLRIIVHFIEKI